MEEKRLFKKNGYDDDDDLATGMENGNEALPKNSTAAHASPTINSGILVYTRQYSQRPAGVHYNCCASPSVVI